MEKGQSRRQGNTSLLNIISNLFARPTSGGDAKHQRGLGPDVPSVRDDECVRYVAPFDTIPVGVLAHIVSFADGMTRPALAFVSHAWCAAVEYHRMRRRVRIYIESNRILCDTLLRGSCFGCKRHAHTPWSDLACHAVYMQSLIKARRTDMVLWAHNQARVPLPLTACAAAASVGDIGMIPWLRRHGCSWDPAVCADAARAGHFDALRWLYAAGCPWDDWAMHGAVMHGHMPTLRWLHKHGAPYDACTTLLAVRRGHMAALKWLHKRRYPFDGKRIAREAAKHGRLDMLRWLRKRRLCALSDARLGAIAAGAGHIDVLVWLYKHGCAWDSRACAAAAAKRGQHKVTRWLAQQVDPVGHPTRCLPKGVNDGDRSDASYMGSS